MSHSHASRALATAGVPRPCRALRSAFWGVLIVSLFGGACGVDAESDTGLLLKVTLHESATVDGASPEADVLRFYVATRARPAIDTWVLDEQLAGRPVSVAGMDLQRDPYRLFVAQTGGDEPPTLRAVVVAEKDGQPVLWATLAQPAEQTLLAGEIVSRTLWLRPADPGATLSWTATGCLLSADGQIRFGNVEDQDCDGYRALAFDGRDCDDLDPEINPAADDSRDCDGKDNDCDGVVDPGGNEDSDGDGVTPCEGDCDDTDPAILPGAEELCDGVDNNCNGLCDEGMDEDGDSFTECNTMLVDGGRQCVLVPHGDCDDADPAVKPGAEEVCDGVDNNCNGLCDEGTDSDGDGYNHCGTLDPRTDPLPEDPGCVEASPALSDCAPDDPAIHPFAPERCDGVDTDCNAETNAPDTLCYTWHQGSDGDFCRAGFASCTEANGTGVWGECLVDNTASDPAPPAYCTAWELCQAEEQPDLCLAQQVRQYVLECTVHLWSPGYEPCVENPPMYYLPFGMSGQSGCSWTLQLTARPAEWVEVGLVDRAMPYATPAMTINACDAALVARPQFDGTAPYPLTGSLSLVDQTTGSPELLVLSFTIHADADQECLVSESMECTLSTGSTPPP